MSDKTDAWMPLWIGAYLADTQHLSRDEHGAYLLLLMAYWRNDGPLPDDDKRLSAIAKASHKEWKELRPTIAEFFVVSDGRWTQKRVEAELAQSKDRKNKAVSKAQAAAGARWSQAKNNTSSNAPSNAPSIPQALLKQCPTPTPIKDSESKDSGGKPPMTPDEIIFGYGVPLLVNAGTTDKAARSFLGGLRKGHGDSALVDSLRNCLREKPLQPLEWLAAALPPGEQKAKPGKHSGFEKLNYREGVAADGSIA